MHRTGAKVKSRTDHIIMEISQQLSLNVTGQPNHSTRNKERFGEELCCTNEACISVSQLLSAVRLRRYSGAT